MKQLVRTDDASLKLTADNWIFGLDQNPEELEREMIQTMISRYGIGLAANQIGLLKRVFVIKLHNYPTITEPLAMFNPRVVSNNGELTLGEEGCLSFPGLWLDVKRYSSIEAEYFDTTGKQCIIQLNGIDARCFLHELDHLNGICFTEQVSKLKLNLALKKQRKNNGRT